MDLNGSPISAPKSLKELKKSVSIAYIETLLTRIYILRGMRTSPMHPHVRANTGAGRVPADRTGVSDSSSGGAARRRVLSGRLRPLMLKPLTYSLMHFAVAVCVAFALTGDWRIALGIGLVEPMVQTVAYILHEKAWSIGLRPKSRGDASPQVNF